MGVATFEEPGSVGWTSRGKTKLEIDVNDRDLPKQRAKPRQLSKPLHSGENEEADTQIVLSLARGLDILSAFRRTDNALGNAELAERTGITKPTVSRLTYTLAAHGFLQFDARARVYSLGVKAIAMGAVAMATTSVRSQALPLMRSLAQGSQFNVGLGMRDAHQMVYIEACEGDALIALRLFPGSRVPLATSAMGRAYLAALPDQERELQMAELRPRYDDDWPRIVRGIEQACSDLATHGFCTSLGDWQKDIHGLAVPVRPIPGQGRFVVNLGGPAYALREADIRDKLGPQLVDLVQTLEVLLGLR
ncbi:MAG: IclR family transcriptional regulator [Rhodospirillaceae bacterium]|nr:MAG: IclR family transcriptional regulator [Rhodospirillaceae bacterium]